jgi:hypothetical protein
VKLLTIQIDACPTAGGGSTIDNIYDSGEDLWLGSCRWFCENSVSGQNSIIPYLLRRSVDGLSTSLI